MFTTSPLTIAWPSSGRASTLTSASPVLTATRSVDPSCRAARGPGSPGRPDGAFGIVLMGDRRAEDRHHGVADELLDGAAVALDVACAAAWYGRRICSTSSGSSCSARAVKPTRSANRTLTTLRSSRGAAGPAPIRQEASRSSGRNAPAGGWTCRSWGSPSANDAPQSGAVIAFVDGTVAAIGHGSDRARRLGGGLPRVLRSQETLTGLREGERRRLHTHHLVREDQQALYGFRRPRSWVLRAADHCHRGRSEGGPGDRLVAAVADLQLAIFRATRPC